MTRFHYVSELEAVRQNLIKMGETTSLLLSDALAAICGSEPASVERAKALEEKTDVQHRQIHDQCLNLIALQAPVARDARLVTGILDAIVDLELIGDYANEIVTLYAASKQRPPSQISAQLHDIGVAVRDTLDAAIDGWREEDLAPAVRPRPDEGAIRNQCRALSDKLLTLLAAPSDGALYASLLIACGNLERILRHALCVATQAADAAPRARA